MASRKQQRKASNAARKARRPQTGVFRHRDGDRRRRGEMRAETAYSIKNLLQQGLLPCPPPSPEGDA
jgi:hypothetical protein